MQDLELFNRPENQFSDCVSASSLYSLNKGSAAVQTSEDKTAKEIMLLNRAEQQCHSEQQCHPAQEQCHPEFISGSKKILKQYKANRRSEVRTCEPVCKAVQNDSNLLFGMTGKAAFTLAEVLITLAIIGVVAAMTIPTLIAKISEKVTQNQQEVFKAKVLKGLNLTRTHGDLNNTYSSTYDFLQNGLGKHLKMAKICDASHTRDCVPYDTILYTTSDNKEDSVDVKDIDSAEELGKTEDEGYKDIASFVMGDGTVVIATYKLDCLVDEGKLDKDLGENECFAGIYNLSGLKKSHKMGKGLFTFNGAVLNINKGPAVLATIGGVKIITEPAVPTSVTKAECEELKANGYPINACNNDTDYWAGAVKTCKDLGSRLPTDAELTKIAQELYNDTSLTNDSKNGLTIDTSKIPSALSGLGSSWYYLWSGSEYSASSAYTRRFHSSRTLRDFYSRSDSGVMAVCVAD